MNPTDLQTLTKAAVSDVLKENLFRAAQKAIQDEMARMVTINEANGIRGVEWTISFDVK